MNDLLDHPPKEFADVIREHFRRRGPFIAEQIRKWADASRAGGFTAHANSMTALKAQFEAKIAKLRAT